MDGAVADPRATMVIQWYTGTIDSKKIQAVRLEIPPRNFSIKRNKNVQHAISTKGHVHNFGLEDLPVISCRGQAYHISTTPSNYGFNSNSAFAGLEYLNAAYVSSGRVSSSPGLTSSVNQSTNTTIASSISTAQQIVQTIQKNASVLSNISTQLIPYGTTTEANEFQIDPSTLPPKTISASGISMLQNILNGALAATTGLGTALTNTIQTLINGITADTAQAVFTQIQNYAATNAQLSTFLSKYEYFFTSLENSTQPITVAGVDPTILNYAATDPFIIINALSAQNTLNEVAAQQQVAIAAIQATQSPGTIDWVITMTIFFQDQVYTGHFTSFNMDQSADVLGLWNWDFTFVAHTSYLIKATKVIQFDRSFDTSLTQLATTSVATIFQSPNQIDALTSLLTLAGL